MLKKVGFTLIIIVILAPISLLLGILIAPVAGWLESKLGFELIGHSGPGIQFYIGIFLLLVIIVLSTVFLTSKSNNED